MKKKGSALILTVAVAAILIVGATCVVALAYSSYRNTKYIEINNKLRLAAESGVEVAHKEIKEHVLRNVDILLNPSDFNPAELTQDSSGDTKPIKIDTGDVEVSVTILPDTDVTTDKYKDIPTGREIDYIRVISEAKYKANPVYKKKIDVYFDKVGVYNVYFDRIFNSSFTTLDKDDEGYTESEKNRNSFCLTNRDISLAGNMYLNGRNVIFKPNLSKFEYYQGNTYIKTNELRTLKEIRKGYHMNSKSVFFKDVDKVEPNDLEGWNDTKLLYLDTLGVIDKEDGNEKANVMQKFTSDDEDVDSDYIELMETANIATYKVQKDVSKGPVNFQLLVNGKNYVPESNVHTAGIYYIIIEKLKESYPTNYLDMYGIYYKLIIIDGDLLIKDNHLENYNNYAIYCTGKVTFEGEAHFYNSSIVAKEIEFESSDKPVEFYGIATSKAAEHVIGENNLEDFSPTDKGEINKYLINNLEGYGDYIKFPVLSWDES
jgi:hypothetical protein